MSQGPKQSYSCNPEILVFLRETQQWSQKMLAEKAGYSERLIVKAESGRSISRLAIEVLAEALSTPQLQLSFEDLISDPVAMAKEYIVALYHDQENIYERVKHILDKEIVFRVAGNPAEIPFAGEHRGIEAVRRLFKTFFTYMEAPANHDHTRYYTYIGQGCQVVVWGESWLHPRGAPLAQPMMISQRMTFRQGKMIMLEDVFDTLYAAEVLR